MKILLLSLTLCSCSYSIHEQNIQTQHERMLKHDKNSKREQQKSRSKHGKKQKRVKTNTKRLIK